MTRLKFHADKGARSEKGAVRAVCRGLFASNLARGHYAAQSHREWNDRQARGQVGLLSRHTRGP